MYISIGGDMAVRSSAVIGIFDLDGASQSRKTMEYLENAERDGILISATDDLPCSFLVTEEFGMEQVYFTQLTARTLEKRAQRDG